MEKVIMVSPAQKDKHIMFVREIFEILLEAYKLRMTEQTHQISTRYSRTLHQV